MAVTIELTSLQRVLGELRSAVESVRTRYGDIPAVQRLLGDLDRTELDATELRTVVPAEAPLPAEEIHLIDDVPPDPALWADAADEGLGGYHR
jgi:hypothetical protein